MSLPNPNKVVTEERLNEYHNTILPFLGGMPDILANKFARGDMYSTDEKIIGQWIDGKPLYQKVVDCGALPNATIKTVDPQISDVDKVIKCFGGAFSGNNRDSFFLPYVTSNKTYDAEIDYTGGYIRLVTSANYSSFIAYAILQYTKTTDSPVEIGLDTDYSTTEKIVGTWIDGKPLYQKTFIATSPSAVNSVKNIAILESGCEIVNLYGILVESDNTRFPINYSYPNAFSIMTYVGGTTVNMIVTRSNETNATVYITFQYTKTTD